MMKLIYFINRPLDPSAHDMTQDYKSNDLKPTPCTGLFLD